MGVLRQPLLGLAIVLVLAVAVATVAGEPARPSGDETVADRLWIWAHAAGVYNDSFVKKLPHKSSIEPIAAAQSMGIHNVMFIRYHGQPQPPFDEYYVPFKKMRQVVWSLTGASGLTSADERAQVLKLAADNPNITGFILDDFFRGHMTGHPDDAEDGGAPFKAALSPSELGDMRRQLFIRGRQLPLIAVVYTGQISPRALEHLRHVDKITLWTWRPDELKDLEANLERLEKLVPGKTVMLGCYMYDFSASRPLPVEMMQQQLGLGLEWLKAGRIEGMIVLATPICDLELEAVESTRQWIARVSRQPLPARAGSTAADASAAAGGEQPSLKFLSKPLLVSPNEGCAVADVNNDRKLDIVAGTHWFAAPDFAARPLRHIEEFQADFLHNNGDHPYDVNGDGWIDVIAGDWLGDEIYWYENPGEIGLKKGLRWKPHLLKKTRGQNEAFFLRDLDGDKVPELVVDCWIDDAPLVAWQLVRGLAEPTLERFVLGERGCGHGMAFGDINGDGREDILTKVGWYECPDSNPLASSWRLHRDWDRPHGSCPFLVVDLTGDGRNDLVWGNGHDYGLFWLEQLEPNDDGGLRFREHLIDRSYSQTHCLHWADLDGDGQGELITGKRVRGHTTGDPGGDEPECLYYYEWDGTSRKFTRHTISEQEGIGTGMQICTADLNGDGRLDIAVAGKTGTWVLLNQGR